jgi:hypothetical protein
LSYVFSKSSFKITQSVFYTLFHAKFHEEPEYYSICFSLSRK